jgi:hypothetical protein
MTVNDVAVSFGVHRIIAQRFMTTSVVKEMPKRLTPREERYIRITAGREPLLTSSKDCQQCTESNWSPYYPRNQSAINLMPVVSNQERSHKGMELTVHHKRQRHACENQHMRRKLEDSTFFG